MKLAVLVFDNGQMSEHQRLVKIVHQDPLPSVEVVVVAVALVAIDDAPATLAVVPAAPAEVGAELDSAPATLAELVAAPAILAAAPAEPVAAPAVVALAELGFVGELAVPVMVAAVEASWNLPVELVSVAAPAQMDTGKQQLRDKGYARMQLEATGAPDRWA